MAQTTHDDCQGVGCLVGRNTHAGIYLPMLTRAPPTRGQSCQERTLSNR